MTGHDGYIGSVMKPMLEEAGHKVFGCDTFYFSDCAGGSDIRDMLFPVGLFDAVIHLAALSNDPMGELNPELTFEINQDATVDLAKLALLAGVKRFLFSSSCSVYGASDGMADETTFPKPLSAYAVSKAKAEVDLLGLASEDFSPVILRNATAFGWSPNFRIDLVLNAMTCAAYTKKHINVVGNGTQWRPLVHVQDICQAFLLALDAPREKIHNQIFNVGMNNYQVKSIARYVKAWFVAKGKECKITRSKMSDVDPRSYQVDFGKIQRELGFEPKWLLWEGIEEMRNKFDELHLTDFSDCVRLTKLKSLMESGKLDKELRWVR
jgi:nucleoside-diphosphate-sugar epimerase